jgi:hypothetical protein
MSCRKLSLVMNPPVVNIESTLENLVLFYFAHYGAKESYAHS